MSQTTPVDADPLTRSEKVLQAAAELLRTGGVQAVSTRAVAAAAGVQPPVIYREFGGMDELLDAVTRFTLEDYLRDKRRRLSRASGDMLRNLRQMWDIHVEFGLAHPETYVLTFGQPRVGKISAGARESIALLEQIIAGIAAEGRLCMPVERATSLVHSASIGTVLTLIPTPPDERDSQLSVLARDNALAAIVNDNKPVPPKSATLTARAVALREAVQRNDGVPLTDAERNMLLEWLARLGGQS
jgi:AcrR family transcriptional regulator